jgi:hypothetical protein
LRPGAAQKHRERGCKLAVIILADSACDMLALV